MKEKNSEKKYLSYILIGALILIIVLLVILIVLIITKKDNSYLKENNFITSNEALSKTLDDVDLTKKDLQDLDIELNYKYQKDVYEINFVYDGYEYEYYVDAKTGEIVKSFKEKEDDIIIDNTDNKDNNQSSNNQSNTDNKPSNNDSTTQNKEYISRDKALSVALEHANVSKNNIYDIDIELDYKYGKEVYEIDFNYQGYEYQYYVDAQDGQILHSFRERD